MGVGPLEGFFIGTPCFTVRNSHRKVRLLEITVRVRTWVLSTGPIVPQAIGGFTSVPKLAFRIYHSSLRVRAAERMAKEPNPVRA